MWSSLVIRFGVAVITFAIGIVVTWVWTTPPAPRQHPPEAATKVEVNYDNADPGTLRHSILEAKARGEKTVEIASIGCGADIGSLRTALSRDTVVLADLVGKKTYADTWGLRTWYRFKTREILQEHTPPPRFPFSFASAPSDMLPIAEDEFLIQEANGQMEIDGVTVTQYSNGAKYREGQTYLLFLWFDPSKRTAMHTGSDALGVFLVDSNGNLTSYVDESYPLKTALAKRFNNSLANMREALKSNHR